MHNRDHIHPNIRGKGALVDIIRIWQVPPQLLIHWPFFFIQEEPATADTIVGSSSKARSEGPSVISIYDTVNDILLSLRNRPENFTVSKDSQNYENWKKIMSHKNLLNTIKNGYKLEISSEPCVLCSRQEINFDN